MKLVNADQMKRLDRKTIREYGIKGLILMENAGRAVADAVRRELSGTESTRVVIIAGKGNNGGDGFVCARHLKNQGYNVTVLSFAEPEEIKADAGVNARIWQKMGGKIKKISSGAHIGRALTELKHAAIVVDSIFGTGLKKPVKGIYADMIDTINLLSKPVVAVDVPSGIDATTGRVLGRAVRAKVTVTMGLPKIGLFLYPGREYAGRVEVADIGMPEEVLRAEDIKTYLIDSNMVRSTFRPRPPDSHKGTFGHMLVVGGSTGKTGAPYMAGVSGLRAGAGLVTVAVPESLNPIMELKTTEVMTHPLPEDASGVVGKRAIEELERVCEGKSVMVIGPGLGTDERTALFVEAALECARQRDMKIVIDADGLNLLARRRGAMKRCKEGNTEAVLTPHPGEMARLMGVDTARIQEDRPGWAKRLSDKTGCVVVLKGASTIVAGDGGFFLNPTGNPALATAGTGDVLSGMIGGFISQGMRPIQAAVAAVYIQGVCADRFQELYGDRGMIATDLIREMPAVINSFVERD